MSAKRPTKPQVPDIGRRCGVCGKTQVTGEGLGGYRAAKVEQPDGVLWHGWSGYGVGAGLEDCGYGFSTEDRNEMLRVLWPESINA